MEDTRMEDTVILFDISRSSYKTDFGERRIKIMQNGIIRFCQTKTKIDPQDSIAIVSFGNENAKILDFTNNFDDIDKKFAAVPAGEGEFSQAISLAIQLLAKQLQKLGDKIQRIFIITDKSSFALDNKTEEIAKICYGLNIYLDVAVLAKKVDPLSKKEYRKFIKMVSGEFGYFNNLNAFMRGIEGFASKKIIENIEDFLSKEKKSKQDPKILNKIAVELRRPNMEEIQKILKKELEPKCQVCYKQTDPTTKQPFYVTGRFCPSCGIPLHLHCAALWAKKAGIGDNIFRCPYCFFLLKVTSKSIKQLESQLTMDSKKEEGTEPTNSVKMVKVPEDKVEEIDDSCTYCSNIFTGEYKVFKCSNCGAYYHEMCLRKIYKELKACRNCGGTIT